MRRRSWFHLSFCQGWTTATLAGRSPGKQAGSLAESTKQCSSSCPWQMRARPCKAFAQISALVASPTSDWVQYFHPVLLLQGFICSCLLKSDLLSTFPLSAFCRCWSHDCSMPQTQQVWKACFLIHRTCDLEFPPQTSAWCLKSPLLQIQSENVPLQKASVLTTFTARPTSVLNKADSFLYICIFCIFCAHKWLS